MKKLEDVTLNDFDLDEEFDDEVFIELSAGGSYTCTSNTFDSYSSNWSSVAAALSALTSKGPGNASNSYTELKCC